MHYGMEETGISYDTHVRLASPQGTHFFFEIVWSVVCDFKFLIQVLDFNFFFPSSALLRDEAGIISRFGLFLKFDLICVPCIPCW